MNFRREVWPWFLGAGGLALASYIGWIYSGWLTLQITFAVCAFFTVFFIYFFRDPDREPDSEAADVWLSPADGVVTRVEEMEDGRSRIVIFLTVFNVHVNRMPVDGKIEEQDYRPGRFLPAFAGNLEQRNEQNRLLCRDHQGREFEVWQIAGMLARRIHFWKDLGDTLQRGDRFGMIALSSRTDLVLPESVTPVVDSKDTVRGGQTVVARG